MYQRPFQSGSRQAPDPFDQFLEQKGFFRKHTARDSSSLFRVVSEQLFDTQSYHETVRKHCVQFMSQYPECFEKVFLLFFSFNFAINFVGNILKFYFVMFAKQIDMNYDKYLMQLSKPRTYGTMVELRALGLCYKRNVVLFDGYNTGSWFLNESGFEKCFYVFFTPSNHFDSVFIKSYIERLAFCQCRCYTHAQAFDIDANFHASVWVFHSFGLRYTVSKHFQIARCHLFGGTHAARSG